MDLYISQLIGHDSGSGLLIAAAIVVCALFFEDLTSIAVGLLAAEGYLGVPTALCSLYIGIILGDALLYTIGVLARTFPRLARYGEHEYTAGFRRWFESRDTTLIFSGHFVPGLRFTTYIASGFFRRPLSTFIPTAVAGGLILGTLLFTVSYWLGNITMTWMRPARWGIALIFLLILFFIGRRNLTTYREA